PSLGGALLHGLWLVEVKVAAVVLEAKELHPCTSTLNSIAPLSTAKDSCVGMPIERFGHPYWIICLKGMKETKQFSVVSASVKTNM
ncbi:hypothetical protein EJB05_53669, partial [Eragrostis curvula]